MESKCGENNHIHEHSFSLAYSLGIAHVMQVNSNLDVEQGTFAQLQLLG